MSMKSQKWQIGDVFTVPQTDGKHSLGQVVGQEREALNSVVCAFFDLRGECTESDWAPQLLRRKDVIALLFVTRDLLDRGRWRVVGWREPSKLGQDGIVDEARSNRYIGVEIRGSGIVEKFLNAFYGLHPWDAWHNPRYLDRLLIDPSRKPPDSRLIFKP